MATDETGRRRWAMWVSFAVGAVLFLVAAFLITRHSNSDPLRAVEWSVLVVGIIGILVGIGFLVGAYDS